MNTDLKTELFLKMIEILLQYKELMKGQSDASIALIIVLQDKFNESIKTTNCDGPALILLESIKVFHEQNSTYTDDNYDTLKRSLLLLIYENYYKTDELVKLIDNIINIIELYTNGESVSVEQNKFNELVKWMVIEDDINDNVKERLMKRHINFINSFHRLPLSITDDSVTLLKTSLLAMYVIVSP
jgi:hypothetical protein